MNWSYAYDPDLWPVLISGALIAFLGWYSWHRRSIPGALPFAFGSLFGALWDLGAVFEIAAVDFSTKIFWAKFQAVWQLPAATALACFILVYTGLGRYLTRRNLVLLLIPPLLVLFLILTDDYHHLFWTQFQMNGHLLKFPGVANGFFVGYAYLLALSNIVLLFWLAVRSPQHRWPVAIMLFGQISGRGLFLLNYIYPGLLGPGESSFVVLGLLSSMYALALFRFHVFDPVPLARSTVIEQMKDGMLVLDLDGKIVDLNPAATKIIGGLPSGLRGRPAAEVLRLDADLSVSDKTGTLPSEISLENGEGARYYSPSLTPLKDRRGEVLGQLLLLYDITGPKLAQSQLLEQQRVVATMQERERLARELHDSVGQVLGFVSIQAQTIRKWVREGDNGEAEPLLIQLAEVAKDAHADVRESILSLKAGSSREWFFLPTLKKYLDNFQANYDIHTELIITEGITEKNFEPGAGVQLLRVVQEALTNARKHGGARNVKVSIERAGSRARITITDDGCGFDLGRLDRDTGRNFGLVFMRERIAQIDGDIKLDSLPGRGTTITVDTPIRIQTEERK